MPNLLEESFPGINITIARCNNLGFFWDELCGRVFVKEKDGLVLSHVAALHAVCTKKDHQGQSLASALTLGVVQWAKKISDFQILFTEIPSFYEKLGFVIIKEHRFHLKHAYKKGSKLFSALAAPKDDNLF